MRIAITTPTGNIGSKLTELLLADGDHELVLLARKPEKVADVATRGAEIEEGDLSDRAYVIRATQNVDSLFWVIPPDLSTKDAIGYYRGLAENACAAIKANGIKHTVFLSSIGAHLGKGVGIINALSAPEKLFRDSAESLAVLRPTFFMENFLPSLATIQSNKSIFMPIRPDAKVAMIATQDIAAKAAKVISEPFSGQRVVPLHGPRDYSFAEATAAISKAIGETIKFVQISPDQMREALMSFGISSHVADLFLEMYDAIDAGRLQPEFPRNADTTTSTTLEEFARFTMAPVVQSA